MLEIFSCQYLPKCQLFLQDQELSIKAYQTLSHRHVAKQPPNNRLKCSLHNKRALMCSYKSSQKLCVTHLMSVTYNLANIEYNHF